jgi:hypothetical protein
MTKRTRRTWTDAEKTRIAAQARPRVDAGEPVLRVARDLNVLQSSLRQWLERYPAPQIEPVVISADDAPAERPAGISIATPDGFVFDGLDLRSALEIWARAR